MEESFYLRSPCDQNVQCAGFTNSSQTRFFLVWPLYGYCTCTAAGSNCAWGRKKNSVLQFYWCWIAWKERFLARVSVSSPHGKHSCTDAHCMKVNVKTPCWIAKFKSGGKPQGSLLFDKADVDRRMLKDCAGVGGLYVMYSLSEHESQPASLYQLT